MTATMSRRVQRLASQGVPFVTATVVHARRPTSVEPGDVAPVATPAPAKAKRTGPVRNVRRK